MRIGINGRFLVAKRTGVQRAAYNLVKTLFDIDNENEYVLFTGDDQAEEWRKYSNVTLVTSPLKIGGNLRNHFWEQFVLPRLAKKHKIDILHSPANMAPLFYSGASVVHIHDLCFVVNPQWYSYTFHTAYNIAIPRLAKKATRVVTNSNNSRNDLLQFYNVDASKVRLIYWAVDQTFGQKEISAEFIPESDYILYVGSLEPRKNIGNLIEAFERMRRRNPDLKTKLVLIGGESPLFADVRVQIKTYHQDVVFKGFVSDEELRAYYRQAQAVAYPSLYEGFGLPPLEAMASGAPVVTSNTSSLPEVVGNAALMVSPYDCDQLADTLALIVRDPLLRREMRARGYEQVKKFNWYRVARNILAVYHEVYCEKNQIQGDNSISFAKWKVMMLKEKAYLNR